jgi:hypothetical protein
MQADVVVVGGGPAGIGAAVRAARNGADTVLIERFNSFGGNNTTGFMFVSLGGEFLGKGVATEIVDRLKPGGYIVNIAEKFPIFSNPLTHFYSPEVGIPVVELLSYDPDMTSYVMSEMLEELGVKFMLRSLFVDALVEGDTIRAVIVENASGKQAVEGKVFVDATGLGDLVARSGAPYVSAGGDEMRFTMPAGLMWKASGVDYEKLLEYQKEDPTLDKITEKAKARGELPYYRPKKTKEQMKFCDRIYTGHPCLEMSPTLYPGGMLFWTPVIHEWALNPAEKAEDLTRAEIHIRKQIVSELSFLKKYVPGFEKAYLTGIPPYLGIREGRHTIGEYVLRYEDIRSLRKFDDVALRVKTFAAIDTDEGSRNVTFDIPYRCFLPKKINNLLVSGDIMSMEHAAFLHIRSFGPAMRLGEVAGTAAALSVKNKVKPKELKWTGVLEDV